MNNNISSLVQDVAKHLSARWDINADGNLVRATDKLCISIHQAAYPKKNTLSIGYVRPRDGRAGWVYVYEATGGGQVPSPSIYVSDTKTAEKIAKDIERRLLTEATRVHGMVVARINQNNDFEHNKTVTITQLAFILNTTPNKAYQKDDFTGEVSPYEGVEEFKKCGYGKFKVSGGDSITLELTSMSKTVAFEIAKAVREILVKHAKQ